MRVLVRAFCVVAAVIFGLVVPVRGAVLSNYSAKVTVDLNQRIGHISPYIYGQYLEHVQREDECIYPSIWDDNSPLADESGLRRDVIAAARELGLPVVRWPGGCFADVYHWEDGIGQQRKRPRRENKHWGGEEPNSFGTDEFLRWCERVGTKAYINANFGSGTKEECLRWLEYCNGNIQTAMGKAREVNGHAKSYDVDFWGIGNETFARWEAGHMDAETYSRTLTEWAEAVRRYDRNVKIMAVGSMSADDPEWDRAVLKRGGHVIDYLTIHNYGISNGRREEFEAVAFTPVYFEQRLRKMISVVDEFASQRRSKEPICLAMDEWNIRHYDEGKLNRQSPRTEQDAVFVAGILNCMIRLSPRVAMANYVFLINGNGVMLVNSNQVVKTPVFHVFKQYGEWMRGEALTTTVQCATVEPPPPKAHYPKYKFPPDFASAQAPYVDAAAALSDKDTIVLALVNRHEAATAAVELELPRGFAAQTVWSLYHEDIFAKNDFADPERVTPVVRRATENRCHCPPHSIALIVCKRQ